MTIPYYDLYEDQATAEADDLIAYIPFNNSRYVGTADTDLIEDVINAGGDGNGINCLISGTGVTLSSAGQCFESLVFPATATKAISSTGDSTTNPKSFAVMFGIYIPTVASSSVILHFDDGAGNGLKFGIDSNDDFYSELTDGVNTFTITTTKDMNFWKQWNRILYTSNAGASTLYFNSTYYNATDSDNMGLHPFDTLTIFPDAVVGGEIDEVAVWDRFLSNTDQDNHVWGFNDGISLINVDEPPYSDTLAETLEHDLSTELVMIGQASMELTENLPFINDIAIGNFYMLEAADSIEQTDATSYTWHILKVLSETLQQTDTLPLPPYAKIMTESLLAASIPTAIGIFDRGVEEELTIEDIHNIAWWFNLAETMDVSDNTDRLVRLVASLVETMYSTDAAAANLLANEVVSETANLADACLRYFELVATESLSVAHTQVVNASFGNELVEALENADTVTDNYGFSVLIEESFTAADGATAGAILQHVLSEGMAFLNITPTINGGTYTGWVMNPETFSVWNYEDYNFNSFASANNEVYAAGTDGLYKIDGGDDDGTDIESRLTTAAIDFGTKNLKQVPQVYLGMTSDGTIVLKVRVDNKYDVWYEAQPVEEYEHTHMIKVGKGLVGRNWQFELVTKDNSSLDIESIEFYPVVFKRKR